MPDPDISVSSAGLSDPDDSPEVRDAPSDTRQELAYWRSLALQADERLRLALEFKREQIRR